MRRAIVVGGGIAGACAAMALARAGLEPVVYESREESAALATGAWLTVAVNGLDALRTLGAHEAVLAAGFASRTIDLVSGSGKLLGTVPIGGTLEDGTVTHTLRRADLYRIVAAEARARGIAIVHGRRAVSAEMRGARAVATFDDGGEEEGDVVIGADGLHSRVRAAIDPRAPRPRYTGLGNVGGFAPPGTADLAPGTYRMIFGRRCFFGLTVAPDGAVWWFANPPRRAEPSREELAAITPDAIRTELIDLASADVGPLAEVIARTEHPLAYTSQHDLPRVPVWSRGAIGIVGDAAHAASPSSGQGASMAIEDAVELGRCMRDVADVPAALRAYESLRRARVERVVAHGARTGSTKTAGPVGAMVRDLVLPWILRRAGPEDPALAWLFRHHIAWDERVAA